MIECVRFRWKPPMGGSVEPLRVNGGGAPRCARRGGGEERVDTAQRYTRRPIEHVPIKSTHIPLHVMAGLVPAIHAFPPRQGGEDVDAAQVGRFRLGLSLPKS